MGDLPMQKTHKPSAESRVEAFLSVIMALALLLLLWGDVMPVKLMMLAISISTLVSLIWLRRYLSREGAIIFAFTFVFISGAVLFNLIYFR